MLQKYIIKPLAQIVNDYSSLQKMIKTELVAYLHESNVGVKMIQCLNLDKIVEFAEPIFEHAIRKMQQHKTKLISSLY